MADTDIDYEVISNSGQLGTPPELRKELVVLPEWKTKSGKATALWQWELGTGEYGEFAMSDRVFDEFGNLVRIKRTPQDVRFLAYTTRDAHNNRIWPTLEAAEDALRGIGHSATAKLVAAANRVNFEGAASADEAVADAEKNSDKTETDAS